VLTGTLTMRRITVPRTGTMDQTGFLVDCSLARVLGSMALITFTAMSIIVLILNTVTADRSLVAAKRRSTTSTPTKPGMAEAMSAQLAMATATKSMLSPAEEAEAEVAARREIRWDK
jgi:hypothetical protein